MYVAALFDEQIAEVRSDETRTAGDEDSNLVPADHPEPVARRVRHSTAPATPPNSSIAAPPPRSVSIEPPPPEEARSTAGGGSVAKVRALVEPALVEAPDR
jgi:hypothetical protein